MQLTWEATKGSRFFFGQRGDRRGNMFLDKTYESIRQNTLHKFKEMFTTIRARRPEFFWGCLSRRRSNKSIVWRWLAFHCAPPERFVHNGRRFIKLGRKWFSFSNSNQLCTDPQKHRNWTLFVLFSFGLRSKQTHLLHCQWTVSIGSFYALVRNFFSLHSVVQ